MKSEFQTHTPSEDTIVAFARRERIRTKRDVDGTLVVVGRHGHLFEFSPGVMGVLIMPAPPRRYYWAAVRKKLKEHGIRIQQNCDGEGVGLFDATNQEQSSVAIKAAGVKRIRKPSPAQVQAARRGLEAANLAKNHSKSVGNRDLEVQKTLW